MASCKHEILACLLDCVNTPKAIQLIDRTILDLAEKALLGRLVLNKQVCRELLLAIDSFYDLFGLQSIENMTTEVKSSILDDLAAFRAEVRQVALDCPSMVHKNRLLSSTDNIRGSLFRKYGLNVNDD